AAEQRLQRPRPVAVVAMAVCDQDVGDALAACGFGDGRMVRLVCGARINDRHAAAADEISVGAEKYVGRGIVGDDAADLRRHLLGDAVVDINASIEGKLCRHVLVKGFWTPRSILAKRDSEGSAARNSTLICEANKRKMWPLPAKT